MLSHLLLAIGLSASIGLCASANIDRASYPNSIGQITTSDNIINAGWFGDYYDNAIQYYYDDYTLTATTLFSDYLGDANPINNYPYGNNTGGTGFTQYRCFFIVYDSQYNDPNYNFRMPYVDVTPDVYVEYEWYANQDYFMMLLEENNDGDIHNIVIQCSNYFADNFNISLFINVNQLNAHLINIQNFMTSSTPYSKIFRTDFSFLDNTGAQSFTLTMSNRNSPAYTSGYSNGYSNGYTNGYDVGLTDGMNNGVTFFSLFGAIADTPLLMLRSLFNFELFGANLLVVVLSLVTGLMVFYVVRKFL